VHFSRGSEPEPCWWYWAVSSDWMGLLGRRSARQNLGDYSAELEERPGPDENETTNAPGFSPGSLIVDTLETFHHLGRTLSVFSWARPPPEPGAQVRILLVGLVK
jgi:hypothetical protein